MRPEVLPQRARSSLREGPPRRARQEAKMASGSSQSRSSNADPSEGAPMSRSFVRLFPLVVVCLVAETSAFAQPTDVFVSEYVEGSSNNKAIEIYNGTAT